MAGYKPVAIQTYPVLGEKITQDTLYWNNYKTPVQIKEFGAVSKVDFSSQPPYNYAVTASSRIHIYGRYSQEPIKTFSRFKDTAYCATFRQDGRLLVAGSEDGGVQLFDISGRAPLRQFEGHTKAVHSVDFTADKYHVVSGADDYTVKLWDIPNSKEILTFKEHSDYVRCGCASKLNPDLFVTGSYDHTVKMFDARTNQSVISVEHGQPVESVLLFPSGGLLVSAGGRYVKVWDMLKGGQLLVSLKNHHKTVTCLCLSSSGQRLLSGSLDRKVKVYSTTSYKVVHSFDYTASILSLALAHEDETIVVGMTNGILSVKHRKSEAKKDSVPRRRRPAYRTFIKGKNYMKQQDDILINRPLKKHLELYDRDLKNFRISKALDRVLELQFTGVSWWLLLLWSMDSSLDVLLSQFGTSRITSWQIGGETVETVTDFIFLGSKITADGDCNHEMKKTLGSLRKSYDQPRQHIKKQRHYFADKGPSSQSCDFSNSHVWM
uniref:UTP15 small subunit processome component n=1 Tax=Ovis aries TaxID=9940 RepID=A0AC11CFS5_SHEEP